MYIYILLLVVVALYATVCPKSCQGWPSCSICTVPEETEIAKESLCSHVGKGGSPIPWGNDNVLTYVRTCRIQCSVPT